MNILDENITRNQRELLERWGINAKQIGYNAGRRGMQDDAIISFLIQERRSTFFTRDADFFDRRLCHPHYGIVHIAAQINESAIFARRLLSHPDFRTQSKRLGKVIRVSSAGISFWQINEAKERRVGWT